MFKLAMATLIKFVILMILPSLLLPNAVAQISVIEIAHLNFIKNQTVISSELQYNNLAITSEVELKENNNEAEANNSLSFLPVYVIPTSNNPKKSSGASNEFLPSPTSFLSYLSLLSTSPPEFS